MLLFHNSVQKTFAWPVLLVVIVPLAPAHSATTISSLPYTISQSNETYVLGSNLTIGAGDGITVNADNVVIDGVGRTLTYCATGVISGKCAGINIDAQSNIEIKNLTLQQGSYNVGADQRGYAIRGTGSSINLHNNTYNLIARRDATDMFGIHVNASGSENELSFSTFNITGENRMKAHDASGSSKWLFHNNLVSVTNLKQPNPGRYARLFNMGNGSEYFDNTISVDSTSEAVNVFVSWKRSNGKIYNNTIDYASSAGRPIILDNGSQNYEVFNNRFTVTSRGGDVYVIRIRDDGTAGSSNHRIHHNTIDASNSSNVKGISFGNSGADNTGNRIYYNIISSPDRPVQFYGDTTSDTDFWCNQLVHTGTDGYPIYTARSAHSDISFSHNIISTDRSDRDRAFFESNISGTGQWKFCSNGFSSSEVAGNASADDFVFLSTSCELGFSQCASEAGAPASSGDKRRPMAPTDLQ